MNKEEAEAEILLSKLKLETSLEQEFNKLSTTWLRKLLGSLFLAVYIIVLIWLYPEILNENYNYMLLLLIFFVNISIYDESARTNKRLDVLYRILKHKEQQNIEVEKTYKNFKRKNGVDCFHSVQHYSQQLFTSE